MMQRYRILHRTYYNFADTVRLGSHTLLLRPREGFDLRIEDAVLETTPAASLRWHRDAEDNCVAIATFDLPTRQLSIESRVVVQRYDLAPLDFIVSDRCAYYPFSYDSDEAASLAAYRQLATSPAYEPDAVARWLEGVWQEGERIQTYVLLQRILERIRRSSCYRRRDEPGVQSPTTTVLQGSGSCRDFAALFIDVARRLGLAARFVSGYSCAPTSAFDFGATHAWAEVYLPGAGWRGFDPTLGELAGAAHIPVAVARSPELVPPVAGTFEGPPGASLDVGVWVTLLT